MSLPTYFAISIFEFTQGSVLAADHDFLLKGGVFSKDQIESYLELKQGEQDRYRMTPHPVEFDMYYSC